MNNIALYSMTTGLPVAGTANVKMTIPLPGGGTKTVTQSANAWRTQVESSLYTEAQLRAGTPVGHRLPTQADWVALATAELGDARLSAERAGWWVALDFGAGPTWALYADEPPAPDGRQPELLGRVAAALAAADGALAAGGPDGVFALRARTLAECQAGTAARLRQHTRAQLAAVLAAGTAHLDLVGGAMDAALDQIEAATTESGVQLALDTGTAVLSTFSAAPTGAPA